MMQSESKLLSVIIPTKNRYNTLIPVLRAILDYITDESIEIIVQDNSTDNKGFFDFLKENTDHRLKYFYQAEDISIVDNTILAIENCQGKYLTFIGDDDLISPYIVDVVKRLDKHNIACLIYNPAYYWWANVAFERETYYHKKNALWIPQHQSLEFEELSSNHELNIMLQSGGGVFSKLPKFYHGIVKREVLIKIKARTGTYLPGPSPDIAFSTAIALVIEKYHYINYPLSVFGASQNSGGGMTARKKHFGEIKDQKFLPKNILEVWNKYIPLVWSEKSIYAQSVTEVLKSFGAHNEFNYIAFYGTMLAYEPYLLRYLKPAIKLYAGPNLLVYFKIALVFGKKLAGIYFRRIKFVTKTFDYNVSTAKNANEVMELLKLESLSSNPINLENK